MNAKKLCAVLLMCAVAGVPARAQAPSYGRVPPAETTAAGGTLTPAAQMVQPNGASRWLGGPPCLLCESDSVNPPIGTELYFNSGVAIPVGNEYLGGELRTGFAIGGGVRTLFYNNDLSAAWVVDTGISHIENSANRSRRYDLRVIDFTGETDITGQPEIALVQYGTALRPGLFIRTTHRTFVNLGVGKVWFLGGIPADADSFRWRFGVDAGGRYGTLSQEYDRIKHRTDVIGGVYAGSHQELEMPCRIGVFILGARQEYSYTWSDILQQKSDIQEVNIMATMGLRF